MIPEDMLNEFNRMLEKSGCAFRLVNDEDIKDFYVLRLASNKYVFSCNINPTHEFVNLVYSFFKERGIKLLSNFENDVYWIDK